MIDGHQHFWQLSRGDYDWLTPESSPELTPIYRDFLPEDLELALQPTSVQRTVLVQAAANEAETDFLLALAANSDRVAAVVGWLDLSADDAAHKVAKYSENPWFRGLRPMLQDIDDTQWILRPQLQPAIEMMVSQKLSFDALVQPKHLPYLKQFVQRYPSLSLVIDHGGKPDISSGDFQPWAEQIAALAKHQNVYCKLSGLVTEAAKDWTVADLQPYVNHLLACFGPNRLIWGSDWPVVNLATDYRCWFTTTEQLLKGLAIADIEQIMGGSAREFYRISS